MIIKMDFDNRKDDPVKQNLRRLLSDTIEEVCLIHSNISFLGLIFCIHSEFPCFLKILRRHNVVDEFGFNSCK